MAIAALILAHWYLAAFFQSFFLHRYAAHRMFSMPKFWERFFYVLSFLSQGAFCLNPRTYAIMHRVHHAYADTEKDPHSPRFSHDPFSMAKNTMLTFMKVYEKKMPVEAKFEGEYPEWPFFDRWVDNRPVRISCCFLYALYYLHFATAWWMYSFLIVHFWMGPIVGTVLNWCGHQYGSVNFEMDNRSRNTLPFDILLLGELNHNNHHAHPSRPNLAVRRFELDLTYKIAKVLSWLGILRFRDELG